MPFKSRYNASFTGDVRYGQKVVTSIISLAAKEIRGVARLQGKEIRVEIVGDTINIDVFIDILMGFSCSDVAYRAQENIKRSIESMTSYKAGIININILGVSFDEEVAQQ